MSMAEALSIAGELLYPFGCEIIAIFSVVEMVYGRRLNKKPRNEAGQGGVRSKRTMNSEVVRR